MMTVKGLQIHYTYRELGLKPEQKRGSKMKLIEFKDTTTPRRNRRQFGIQCTHTLKTHEKLGQIIGGKNWGVGELRELRIEA